MGIQYKDVMLVGAKYGDLPDEVKKHDDIFKWADSNGLYVACSRFDCDLDEMILGIEILDTSEEEFDEWCKDVKETFKKVKKLLKVKPRLISTCDIY